MRFAVLLALFGVAFALPVEEHEAVPSLSQDIRSSKEIDAPLDAVPEQPNSRESKERDSAENDEDNEFEFIFHSMLDFIDSIASTDSRESKEESTEEDSNFFGYIVGMFWDSESKEPVMIAERISQEDFPPKLAEKFAAAVIEPASRIDDAKEPYN